MCSCSTIRVERERTAALDGVVKWGVSFGWQERRDELEGSICAFDPEEGKPREMLLVRNQEFDKRGYKPEELE
jgi:hypothetical protein